MEEIQSATDRLLAIEEIKSVSARYALGLDTFDVDGILSVFTEDAGFDVSRFELGKYRGHGEMRGFFQHNGEVMDSQMHLFSNFLIELEGPDSASGTSYLYQDGYDKKGQQMKCHVLNRDKYIRTSDGWKIAERVCHPLVAPQIQGYNEGL